MIVTRLHWMRGLALAATFFGGVALGLGNAFLDDHRHHHATAVVQLDAQCVFCLDGVAPAPVALFGFRLHDAPRIGLCNALEQFACFAAESRLTFEARAPPVSV